MQSGGVALDDASWERLRNTVQEVEAEPMGTGTPPRSATAVSRDVALFVLRTELVPGGTAVGTRVTYDVQNRAYCGNGGDELVIGVSGNFRWGEGSVVTALNIPGAGWCVFVTEQVAQFMDGTSVEDVPAHGLVALCPGSPTLPGAYPICKPGNTGFDDLWLEHYMLLGDNTFRYRMGANGPELLEAASVSRLPGWAAWDYAPDPNGGHRPPAAQAVPRKNSFRVTAPTYGESAHGGDVGREQQLHWYIGYKPHVSFTLNTSPGREVENYVPEIFYHSKIPIDLKFGPPTEGTLPLVTRRGLPYGFRTGGISMDPQLVWIETLAMYHQRIVARTGRDQTNFDESEVGVINTFSGDRPSRISVPSDRNGNYL